MSLENSTIIARRRTHDGYTVVAFDDGCIAFGNGRVISKGLNRTSMGLFLDDIGSYDGDEAKTLASVAKRAVHTYPDSTVLARRFMRTTMGPPVKRNPLQSKDYVFIGAAVLSSIAVLYEIFKKPASGVPSGAPPQSDTDVVFSYDGQVITLPVGHTITTNLIFSPPQAGWRLADAVGTALAVNPGGLVNSTASGMTIQMWKAVNPGSETVTYQAIDKTGADIIGSTMSFTANVVAGNV